MGHYHLCINLPPPALLISDSSLAPAAAGGGDRPMFQTALAPNLWRREQTKDRPPAARSPGAPTGHCRTHKSQLLEASQSTPPAG